MGVLLGAIFYLFLLHVLLFAIKFMYEKVTSNIDLDAMKLNLMDKGLYG